MCGVTRFEIVLIVALLAAAVLLLPPALQRARETGDIPNCANLP